MQVIYITAFIVFGWASGLTVPEKIALMCDTVKMDAASYKDNLEELLPTKAFLEINYGNPRGFPTKIGKFQKVLGGQYLPNSSESHAKGEPETVPVAIERLIETVLDETKVLSPSSSDTAKKQVAWQNKHVLAQVDSAMNFKREKEHQLKENPAWKIMSDVYRCILDTRGDNHEFAVYIVSEIVPFFSMVNLYREDKDTVNAFHKKFLADWDAMGEAGKIAIFRGWTQQLQLMHTQYMIFNRVSPKNLKIQRDKKGYVGKLVGFTGVTSMASTAVAFDYDLAYCDPEFLESTKQAGGPKPSALNDIFGLGISLAEIILEDMVVAPIFIKERVEELSAEQARIVFGSTQTALLERVAAAHSWTTKFSAMPGGDFSFKNLLAHMIRLSRRDRIADLEYVLKWMDLLIEAFTDKDFPADNFSEEKAAQLHIRTLRQMV